ncbi:MAG: 1,4-alpha-glucan branching protein GlgB [Desulfopila sp.]|jgi:1,4-alpha-glucan branching enzyme|nr:1,4-alpha-glucan branching protein GlgB [Desulfopila sp.]
MNELLEKIISADHHDPFEFLGVHFPHVSSNIATVRTFQPHAEKVDLLCDGRETPMERRHHAGLFVAEVDKKALTDPDFQPFNYQYKITFHDGTVMLRNDPYRFLPQLAPDDSYLFNFGTNYQLYDHLGSHLKTIANVAGTVFRVWAPSAKRVSVVGHFNGWDGRVHAMRSLGSSGIWELFIPGIGENELYKFEIKTSHDDLLLKSDPFQFYGELRPATASIVRDLNRYTWNDHDWMSGGSASVPYSSPMSIYEVHPGSWQRDPADPDRFLTFRELADKLIPHVKKLGFTHIELLPVMEHPLDESWGYQVTGPFSMTSRYGVPEDFMFFVDQCHQNNIGVILDWVPAHFPKDSHSLAYFDGTALFEHEDPRKGAHPEWGTYIFNYGRKEVSNYLISNALFWIDKYHIDGLRVDAVSSMLYLDYARKDGEWVANEFGGRENLEAIEFLKHLNSIVYDRYPRTLMIAEESTSYYGVSKPADLGGLGFGFKWNMGWMNDTLSYFSQDPIYRKFHHNNLTFSLMYAFSENFILPMSHDEVVHGKSSLINKMPGDLWQQFANLRLLYTLQWCHPGKKLLFMGGEFGQFSEWYCKRSLDWHLLEENTLHSKLMIFLAELNLMYKNTPALWQNDFDIQGFQWLDFGDSKNSIISFARFGTNFDDHIVCLLNFTPQTLYDYKIPLPSGRNYRKVLCSDDIAFGGSNACDSESFPVYSEPLSHQNFHTRVTVPPLAGLILQPEE